MAALRAAACRTARGRAHQNTFRQIHSKSRVDCAARESNRPSGIALLTLPQLQRAGHDGEQRMGLGKGYLAPPAMKSRIACLQLAQKMPPLVLDLASSTVDMNGAANRPDLGPVERVTARVGFEQDGTQIGVDGRTGSGVGLEPMKLRMMAVAFGRAAKNSTRQEGLTPQRNKTLRIKIPRMKSPQSHVVSAGSGA